MSIRWLWRSRILLILNRVKRADRYKGMVIISSELRAGGVKTIVNIWWGEADSDESKNEILALPLESAPHAKAAADRQFFFGPDYLANWIRHLAIRSRDTPVQCG